MLTSVINRHLSLNRERVKGFISEDILGLIRIYNVCGVKDERAWDLFYDIIFLDPVTTCHFSQFQLMWPHHRSRSSPCREWWAAFRSCMGQMFDTARDQMINWRWDNPRAYGDQVDRTNPQTTSLGKVKRIGEHFSWYSSDDPRAKIESPSCPQYKPGDFLAVRPLNWDDIIDEDDDDDNWADPGVPSGGKSRPSDPNYNDDSKCEKDTQGSEQGPGKGKGTKDGKGKGKGKATEEGKGKGNGKGKGIVKQTPGEDDISRAVAVQKEMYDADSDTEGQLERVYLELEASPAVSISSDDDTDSTELDGQYHSELDPDVDMHMQDDVDAPDGVDLDGDVDMERDGDDDEEEEDEEKEDEEEVEEEDEDEEEDQDEDDGKELQMLGQGEMVNTSADDVDTMVDDQPIVLPEQGQEMPENTPWLQPSAPAPRPQTPEPHP